MDGKATVVAPYEGGYSNNAACVGGGTLSYGAMAWRFIPTDFQMASKYGVPAGSTLADWPISYDDLEPTTKRPNGSLGSRATIRTILSRGLAKAAPDAACDAVRARIRHSR